MYKYSSVTMSMCMYKEFSSKCKCSWIKYLNISLVWLKIYDLCSCSKYPSLWSYVRTIYLHNAYIHVYTCICLKYLGSDMFMFLFRRPEICSRVCVLRGSIIKYEDNVAVYYIITNRLIYAIILTLI